jgi:hypothetical protein
MKLVFASTLLKFSRRFDACDAKRCWPGGCKVAQGTFSCHSFRASTDLSMSATNSTGRANHTLLVTSPSRVEIDRCSRPIVGAETRHSGDPAYNTLPAYFQKRLRPALQTLLEAVAATGKVRGGVEPYDLLRAVASLCTPAHDVGPDHARRRVDLHIDGLRYGAIAP